MNDELARHCEEEQAIQAFITHHSALTISPSPLDLARFLSLIPLSRGGDFVLQGDYMLADGGLRLWCVAQESGIVVPLDGYPTSHNPGDCDGYSIIDLR